MHSYAQTSIQLFNQLCRHGYSSADLVYILKAYDLAVCLFTCRFVSSGKTSITHVVGTASILSSLDAPAKVVAAGLLHNAYQNGDFGHGPKGITDLKREQVRCAVGREVEQYVARFATLRWNKETIPAICESLAELDPLDREVVLIRLADHLEHHLDRGVLYSDDVNRKRLMDCNDHMPTMVEIAQQLGFPALATELVRVIRDTVSAEIPMEILSRNCSKRNSRVPPKSYRLRLSIAIYQQLARVRRRIRFALRFRKNP